MTVSMLRDAGVEVDDTTANRWTVQPGAVAARHWTIEPDLSNAVPFLAAGVVSGGAVRVTGWPAVSTQPAEAILDILEKVGAVVRQTESYLEVQGTRQYDGFEADLHDGVLSIRIPVAEQHLPYRDDSLGRAALAALDDLRLPLRERLKRKVSDIYTDSGDMP